MKVDHYGLAEKRGSFSTARVPSNHFAGYTAANHIGPAMFGSNILDVAVGLVFVFLIASLICTAIREGVESWFKTRAVYLEQGIRELMCGDLKSVADLYGHPLVSALFKGRYNQEAIKHRRFWESTTLPTYIPSRNFALALLDVVVRGPVCSNGVAQPKQSISVSDVSKAIATIPQPELRRVLLVALDLGHGDIEEVQRQIEHWYDSAMERVAGWYKRRTQLYLFLLGLSVAVVANVNAITIARYLYRDPGTRAALVANAGTLPSTLSASSPNIDTLLTRLHAVELPIGWRPNVRHISGWDDSAPTASLHRSADPSLLARILSEVVQTSGILIGWLITALAITLGAPFWFDLLSRFMQVRSTIKPQQGTP